MLGPAPTLYRDPLCKGETAMRRLGLLVFCWLAIFGNLSTLIAGSDIMVCDRTMSGLGGLLMVVSAAFVVLPFALRARLVRADAARGPSESGDEGINWDE